MRYALLHTTKASEPWRDLLFAVAVSGAAIGVGTACGAVGAVYAPGLGASIAWDGAACFGTAGIVVLLLALCPWASCTRRVLSVVLLVTLFMVALRPILPGPSLLKPPLRLRPEDAKQITIIIVSYKIAPCPHLPELSQFAKAIRILHGFRPYQSCPGAINVDDVANNDKYGCSRRHLAARDVRTKYLMHLDADQVPTEHLVAKMLFNLRLYGRGYYTGPYARTCTSSLASYDSHWNEILLMLKSLVPWRGISVHDRYALPGLSLHYTQDVQHAAPEFYRRFGPYLQHMRGQSEDLCYASLVKSIPIRDFESLALRKNLLYTTKYGVNRRLRPNQTSASMVGYKPYSKNANHMMVRTAFCRCINTARPAVEALRARLGTLGEPASVVVAHADDEVIFGIAPLATHTDVELVLATKPRPRLRHHDATLRQWQFIVGGYIAFGAQKVRLMGFEEGRDHQYSEEEVRKLCAVTAGRRVYTHSPHGEYGHLQHRLLSAIWAGGATAFEGTHDPGSLPLIRTIAYNIHYNSEQSTIARHLEGFHSNPPPAAATPPLPPVLAAKSCVG